MEVGEDLGIDFLPLALVGLTVVVSVFSGTIVDDDLIGLGYCQI
jgi:hypothetical protein